LTINSGKYKKNTDKYVFAPPFELKLFDSTSRNIQGIPTQNSSECLWLMSRKCLEIMRDKLITDRLGAPHLTLK